MILRPALLIAFLVAPGLTLAADGPRRVPPDKALLSQSIAAPPAVSRPGDARAWVPARKAERVRHTSPAPKRM